MSYVPYGSAEEKNLLEKLLSKFQQTMDLNLSTTFLLQGPRVSREIVTSNKENQKEHFERSLFLYFHFKSSF